ncbi:MAG: SPOR domain-containing protein [Spirochaetaceae bacterium]|nr:SPOR domain-containing protein [Spirochaetaceae bacterium]
MSTENTRSPALVVVLSILGILAITLITGLLLMQKQDNSGILPGTVLSSRQENTAADEFDPISWAREGAEYPPLQETVNSDEDFVADYTGNGAIPDENPADPVISKQPVVVSPPPQPVSSTPEPAYREVRENAFWVQVIASRNVSTAEAIRDSLAEQGLPAHVMTQDTGKEIVYRVRLGAFDSKDEAENYAGTVRSIDGFADSYVTIAPVTRRIPISN